MRQSALFFGVFWMVLCIGCADEEGERKPETDTVSDAQGPETDSGSDGERPDTSSDTGCAAPSEEWPCPAPAAAVCEDAVSPLPVLLTAADLGDDVVFTALGDRSVLAIRRRETEQAVILVATEREYAEADSGTAVLALEPDANVSAVAVANRGNSSDIPAPIATICVDGVCALYGAEIAPQSTVELVALNNGTPPDVGDIVGMWTNRELSSDKVCLYGTMISCFDGASWEIMYPHGDGTPAIADMEQLGFGIVAAGERGLIVHDGFPAWYGSWGEEYPDLVSVVVDDNDYLAVSRDGQLYNNLKMWNPPCRIIDDEIAHFTYAPGLGQSDFLGATASGELFVGEGAFEELKEFCFAGQQLDDVVDIATNTCGIAQNRLILTSDTLYGTTDCAID
jgi:hypothetical protein